MISDTCTQEIKDEKKTISCSRPTYADNLCILHHKHSEKDPEKFRNELKRTLEDKTSKIIDLREVTFPGGYIIFKDREVKKPIIFDNSIFLGRPAHFEGTIFEKKCSFRNVVFHSAVLFDKCLFKELTNFNYARIERGGAHFKTCTFENEVDFGGTNFDASTQFTNDSVFKGKVSFENAIVASSISIKDSTFEKELSFNECTVRKMIYFVNVKLRGTNSFEVGTLDGGTFSFQKIDFYGRTNFSERHFNSNPPTFTRCDLKEIRLLHVLIPSQYLEKERVIHLDSCKWPTKRFAFVTGRKIVADEKYIKKSLDLLRLYKFLHKKFFTSSEYQLASEFYVGYMIQKRKLQSGEWLAKAIDTFYSFFSRYGVSIWRPFFALLAMWLLVPVLLMKLGIYLEFSEGKPFHLATSVFSDYVKTVFLNIQLSTLVRSSELRPPITSWQSIVIFIETVLNALFIGFFALGIRRRTVPKQPVE